jgi:hypothetical protein
LLESRKARLPETSTGPSGKGRLEN